MESINLARIGRCRSLQPEAVIGKALRCVEESVCEEIASDLMLKDPCLRKQTERMKHCTIALACTTDTLYKIVVEDVAVRVPRAEVAKVRRSDNRLGELAQENMQVAVSICRCYRHCYMKSVKHNYAALLIRNE